MNTGITIFTFIGFYSLHVLYMCIYLIAIHTTLQALPPGERTLSNLHRRFSKGCLLAYLVDPLSVQSCRNYGFVPCLRVLLCSLTQAGFEPMPIKSCTSVSCLINREPLELLPLQSSELIASESGKAIINDKKDKKAWVLSDH